MKSNTKTLLNQNTIIDLCGSAGFKNIQHVKSMGAGEFNAVYAFDADGQEYALKIAPEVGVPVMTYEMNMMHSEVYWYDQLRTHTDIRVPKVYYTDFSKKWIPSDFFIMGRIRGRQMDEMDFSPSERKDATAKLPQMAAQIHSIRHDGFGYPQNGYHASWDQALGSMVEAVICDAERMRHSCENGKRMLACIKRHRDVLARVECRMVNFDLWLPNILCERMGDTMQYTWIDPERSFWGDPVMDFICFETDKPLEKKLTSLEAYNQVAEQPLTVGRDEKIRFAFAQAYLGIIMEVERYFRYIPGDEGWTRNDRVCEGLLAAAFGCLEKE